MFQCTFAESCKVTSLKHSVNMRSLNFNISSLSELTLQNLSVVGVISILV